MMVPASPVGPRNRCATGISCICREAGYWATQTLDSPGCSSVVVFGSHVQSPGFHAQPCRKGRKPPGQLRLRLCALSNSVPPASWALLAPDHLGD